MGYLNQNYADENNQKTCSLPNSEKIFMKQKALIFSLMLSSSICFCQTNPEDIIIVHDSLNPNGKIIIKSDLISDLDSLSIHLVDDKRNDLLAKKDILTIKKLLIGNWILESTKRVNGKPLNLHISKQFTFNENGDFIQMFKEDIIHGKWFVKKEINGNLVLNYNEPQISIKDKEILKHLSKEQIKAMTYSSNVFSIMEINEQSLIFSTFIPENTEQIDKMFYRLILITYKRIKL